MPGGHAQVDRHRSRCDDDFDQVLSWIRVQDAHEADDSNEPHGSDVRETNASATCGPGDADKRNQAVDTTALPLNARMRSCPVGNTTPPYQMDSQNDEGFDHVVDLLRKESSSDSTLDNHDPFPADQVADVTQMSDSENIEPDPLVAPLVRVSDSSDGYLSSESVYASEPDPLSAPPVRVSDCSDWYSSSSSSDFSSFSASFCAMARTMHPVIDNAHVSVGKSMVSPLREECILEETAEEIVEDVLEEMIPCVDPTVGSDVPWKDEDGEKGTSFSILKKQNENQPKLTAPKLTAPKLTAPLELPVESESVAETPASEAEAQPNEPKVVVDNDNASSTTSRTYEAKTKTVETAEEIVEGILEEMVPSVDPPEGSDVPRKAEEGEKGTSFSILKSQSEDQPKLTAPLGLPVESESVAETSTSETEPQLNEPKVVVDNDNASSTTSRTSEAKIKTIELGMGFFGKLEKYRDSEEVVAIQNLKPKAGAQVGPEMCMGFFTNLSNLGAQDSSTEVGGSKVRRQKTSPHTTARRGDIVQQKPARAGTNEGEPSTARRKQGYPPPYTDLDVVQQQPARSGAKEMKGTTARRRRGKLPPTADQDVVQQQPARASRTQVEVLRAQRWRRNPRPCADLVGDVVPPVPARAEEVNPLHDSETGSSKHAPEMAMGFFNQLAGLGHDVVPRPTPKPKPKENLRMGFFTQLEMQQQQQENAPKRRRVEAATPQEESRTVLPVDDRAYTMVEYFMVSFLRPITLHGGSYTPFASNFCWTIVVLHTIETLFTSFGPKAQFLHLPFAFIRPLQHFLIDHILIGSLVLCVLVHPQDFGPFPYHKAVVLSLLLVIYHFLCPRTSVCEVDRQKLVEELHVSRVKSMSQAPVQRH